MDWFVHSKRLGIESIFSSKQFATLGGLESIIKASKASKAFNYEAGSRPSIGRIFSSRRSSLRPTR